MNEKIIDNIYEAAVLPELWPAVLGEISDVAGAEGGIMIAARGADSAWLASPAIAHHAEAYFGGGYVVGDDRTVRLLRLAHPGFVVDYDVFTPEEFVRDPVMRDFFRARGLGWGVATAINAPSGDVFVIHCERRFDAGPVDHETAGRLNVFRPHLARAAILSGRLDMMKATATVEALQLLDLPSAVVAHSGRLLAANSLMVDLMPATVRDGRDRMGLADPAADLLFAGALAGAVQGELQRPVQSIALRSRGEGPAMVVHVIPVRGVGRDVLVGSRCVVIITPVQIGLAPSPGLLQGLFDLTPAEARIASNVAAGLTVEEIAAANGTTLNTLRNQLKEVMHKTGCRRQTELALLLTSLAPPSKGA